MKLINKLNPIRKKTNFVSNLSSRPKIFSKKQNIMCPPSKTGIGSKFIKPSDTDRCAVNNK